LLDIEKRGSYMDIGIVLLLGGFTFLLSDAILLIVTTRIKNWLFLDNACLYIASFLILGSYLEFVLNLIVQDYSYSYVTSFSDKQMDILMRFASSWSGASGSFFLWTIFMFIGYIVFRSIFRKMLDQKIYQYSSFIQSVNLLVFIIFTVLKEPFARNTTLEIDGLGLNPLLASFFNLIHPPLTFLGYALFIIPFSIALAKLFLKQTDNESPTELQRFARFTMASGWLTLGVAILAGGYWAYTTLGWGGFWAWDPVETGSLIPWLFALVYFHGSPVFRSFKDNFSKEIIITLPFLSVLIATIITRTGLLQSVHAFELSVADYIIIVYFLILFGIELFIIYKVHKTGIIKFFYSLDELKNLKQQDAALYISFIAFFLGTIAIMTGLVVPLTFALLPEPFNQSFGVDTKYFNIIIGIFGFAALESAFFTDFVFIKSNTRKLQIISLGVTLGLLNVFLNLPLVNYYFKKANLETLFVITHFLGTTSVIANFIMPSLLLTLFILLFTGYRFIISKHLQKQIKMRKVSQTLLHLGIVIALIGALISYNNTQITDVLLKPDTEGYVTTDQTVSLKVINTHYERYGKDFERRLEATVQLTDRDKILGTGLLEYTEYTYFGLIVNVIIISSLTMDYYLTISTFTVNDGDNSLGEIRFQIRIIPMVTLLWIGSILVLIATLALVIMSFRLFFFSYRNSMRKIQSFKTSTRLKINPVEGFS